MAAPIKNNNDQKGATGISNEDFPESISVKTKFETKKPSKEIDIMNISADDLKSIRQQDPFLYYSIPGVRSANLLMMDIDDTNLGASELLNRASISRPPRLESNQDQNTDESQKVARSSCISFECYPDMILDDEIPSDGEEWRRH